jgi:two-component sensor histidine kinase
MGSPIRQQPRETIVAPSQAIDLLPEQATAVAMILNELATNSVKHAFKNGGQGQVEVRLTQESQAPGRPRIHVEYRDDGPGWPEAVLRGESKQVGLQLIEASVRSPLRGELRLRNDHGAVADLAFLLALNN